MPNQDVQGSRQISTTNEPVADTPAFEIKLTEAQSTVYRMPENPGEAHRLCFKNSWEVIDRMLPHAGRIQLVPANQSFADRFSAAEFEAHGSTGLASEAMRYPLSVFPARLANLWYSSYNSPDGRIEFGYFRSGTLCRYGELDSDSRMAAAVGSALQLVEAAKAVVTSRFASGALDHHQTDSPMHLVSFDLQSGQGSGELEIEQMTVVEQRMALSSLNGHPWIVREVERKLAVESFNFPTLDTTHWEGVGWHLEPETIASIATVIERSLRKVDPNLLPVMKPVSEEVYRLLQREEDQVSNPLMRFALVARVAFMSACAGEIVHANCRSGKDRTGFFDVELKFLGYQAFRRLRGEPVSAPAEAPLPQEAAAWEELLLKGGNHEIQELNCGLPGSKLVYGALKNRVGAHWDQFIDASFEANL